MADTTTTAAMPVVNMAIVGFSGLIGTRHTRHVLANPSTRLAALVDPAAAAAGMAAELGVDLPYFRDVGAMLGGGVVVDAAIVCTPNTTHAPLAIQLLDAGIHVLVEKPITADVASGLDLLQRASQQKKSDNNSVHLLVGHHRRFNPYVLAAKQALDEGLLGDVTAVSALWAALKPPEYFSDAEWRRSRRAGGGVVLINLVHEVDLLQFLFGPVVRVHAEKTVTRRTRRGRDGDDDDLVEEGAALTLRFKDGVVGSFILSDAVASPHFFEAGTSENPLLPRVTTGEDGQPVDVYRIFGTRGTLSVPDLTLWTYPEERGSWRTEMRSRRLSIDEDERVPFERQLDHFVALVRGVVGEPRCSGEDGLRALAVCEAVRRALEGDGGFGSVVIPEDFGVWPVEGRVS